MRNSLFIFFLIALSTNLKAQNVKIDSEIWDALCETVCLHDLKLFKEGVEELTESWPGTKEERVNLFYSKYIYELKSFKKDIVHTGAGACSHKGKENYNIMQLAISDYDLEIPLFLVDSMHYDINKILPSGISTLEFLRALANKEKPTDIPKDFFHRLLWDFEHLNHPNR